jgi:hypothetical protein
MKNEQRERNLKADRDAAKEARHAAGSPRA